VVEERESRSLLSVGIAWASRITTLALEFSVPVVVGVGLDRWWRTSPLLTVSGAILGFGLFMYQVLRMARELATQIDRPTGRSRDDRR
jgi:F0F1-type ATP synthase assembly protein I